MDLISCLCVSKPSRWGQLQRAMLDFNRQTYRDKELVIVVDARSDYHTLITAFAAEHCKGHEVRVLPYWLRSQGEGMLVAQAGASGRVLTFWDDDNLNHANRLELQADKLSSAWDGLVVCTHAVYYFHDADEVFFVPPPRSVAGKTADRVLCSTIMGRRAAFLPVLPVMGQHAGRGILAAALAAGKKVIVLDGYYHLVGVTYDNLSGSEAMRATATTRGLTREQLMCKDKPLPSPATIEALGGFYWDKPFTVSGTDGRVTEWVPDETSQFPVPALFPVETKDANVQVVNERSPE